MVEASELPKAPGDRLVFIETRNVAPRDFHIRIGDADKYGVTRGCGGCSSSYRGEARQPHTVKCRERLRELMKDEAKVKNNEIRKRTFEEHELERKSRKGDKKYNKRTDRSEKEEEDPTLVESGISTASSRQ